MVGVPFSPLLHPICATQLANNIPGWFSLVRGKIGIVAWVVMSMGIS
jgi:hypothetical protein